MAALSCFCMMLLSENDDIDDDEEDPSNADADADADADAKAMRNASHGEAIIVKEWVRINSHNMITALRCHGQW